MSRNGCGTPADILFKNTKNEAMIYKINSTVIMIGTLLENVGVEEARKTLKKGNKD